MMDMGGEEGREGEGSKRSSSREEEGCMMDMEEGMGMLYNLRVALFTERGWRECFVWTRKKKGRGKRCISLHWSPGETDTDMDMDKGVRCMMSDTMRCDA